MAADDHAGKPFADGFIRFLLPAPKPRPAAPTPPACLVPPHRLVAPPLPRPRPDERLFIVPPTRPDWLPPPPPPGTGVNPRPFTPPNEHRARNAARLVAGNGNDGRGRSPGALPPNGGRAGPERRKVTAHRDKEKKAWVAVEKKREDTGDDDRAVVTEGYSGGDEDDDQHELDGDQEAGGRRLRLDHLGDVKNSLVTASIHDCPDGGDGVERPVETNQAPRLRNRTRRGQVECRHDIDTFTPGFIALYESLKPTDELKSKQQQLVDSLAKSVRKEWPNAQLHLYGSCANSFGTSHSDVDVCLEMEIGTESTVEILLRLAEILRTENFESVEAITTARVPIVRTSDPDSGFSCDICINNLFAVANTKLLKDYAQIDQRLLQLAFLVKHWAKLRGVNEAYRGTLSSYAYVIMCINFLQLREPKILPCLQVAPFDAILMIIRLISEGLADCQCLKYLRISNAMEPTYELNVDGTECTYFDKIHQLHDFSAENKDSIAKLLWGFFHYWALDHDYRNDVISVRLGKTITKQEKNWMARVGNDRHLMCIEDPLETGHDLGRVVDRQTIRVLREEFERAAAVLQHDHDPCVTLFEPYAL